MFFFWGWGENAKHWEYTAHQVIVVTWNYFHIFFFPVAFNVQWHVMGENRSEDQKISYEKVRELVPTDTPALNVWHRYGLLIGLAVLFGYAYIRKYVG